MQATKLDSDPSSHSASASRKNTLPAPAASSFDPAKAPHWIRSLAKVCCS